MVIARVWVVRWWIQALNRERSLLAVAMAFFVASAHLVASQPHGKALTKPGTGGHRELDIAGAMNSHTGTVMLGQVKVRVWRHGGAFGGWSVVETAPPFKFVCSTMLPVAAGLARACAPSYRAPPTPCLAAQPVQGIV